MSMAPKKRAHCSGLGSQMGTMSMAPKKRAHCSGLGSQMGTMSMAPKKRAHIWQGVPKLGCIQGAQFLNSLGAGSRGKGSLASATAGWGA